MQERCFLNPPTFFRNASDIVNKCKSGVSRTRRLAIALHLFLRGLYGNSTCGRPEGRKPAQKLHRSIRYTYEGLRWGGATVFSCFPPRSGRRGQQLKKTSYVIGSTYEPCSHTLVWMHHNCPELSQPPPPAPPGPRICTECNAGALVLWGGEGAGGR